MVTVTKRGTIVQRPDLPFSPGRLPFFRAEDGRHRKGDRLLFPLIIMKSCKHIRKSSLSPFLLLAALAGCSTWRPLPAPDPPVQMPDLRSGFRETLDLWRPSATWRQNRGSSICWRTTPI